MYIGVCSWGRKNLFFERRRKWSSGKTPSTPSSVLTKNIFNPAGMYTNIHSYIPTGARRAFRGLIKCIFVYLCIYISAKRAFLRGGFWRRFKPKTRKGTSGGENAPMYIKHTLNVHRKRGNVHRMGVILGIFLVCGAIGGCSPSDPVSGIAYYQGQLDATQQARIENTQLAGEKSLKQTEAARLTAAWGTQRAEETLGEIGIELTRMAITKAALDLRGTEASAQLTSVPATAAFALRVEGYQATGTAIRARAEEEPSRQAWSTFAFGFIRLAGAILGAILLLTAYLYIRARLRVWEQYKLMLISGSGWRLSSGPVDQEEDEETLYEDAMTLVELAMRVNGRASHEIPRWQTIGWSSEKWQRVTGWLAGKRALDIRGGVGTKVTRQYRDVTGLWIALRRGEIGKPPTPPKQGNFS